MSFPNLPTGFSLLEMLIGMFLSAVLMSGVTGLLSNSVSAYRQQLNEGQLEESSRFAHEVLTSHIAQAGYHPQPWQAMQRAVSDDSLNGGPLPGDQLGLQRWSSKNCYGNENPVRDAEDKPEFYLLQVRFSVTQANNLAMTCRYGPDASQLTTQVNNFGLVENVESMQVLYAQDHDDNGIVDGWVSAGTWQQESTVRAVKVALLFASQSAFGQDADPLTLLDETITPPADGHLRIVTTLTTAIRGRLK